MAGTFGFRDNEVVSSALSQSGTKGSLRSLYFLYIMLRFRRSELWCIHRTPIDFSKLQSGTNNPQISQRMRYAQLVGSGYKQRLVHMSNGQEIGLRQRTIVPLTN